VARVATCLFLCAHVGCKVKLSWLCFCILQAIKNWSHGRPGNEARVKLPQCSDQKEPYCKWWEAGRGPGNEAI